MGCGSSRDLAGVFLRFTPKLSTHLAYLFRGLSCIHMLLGVRLARFTCSPVLCRISVTEDILRVNQLQGTFFLRTSGLRGRQSEVSGWRSVQTQGTSSLAQISGGLGKELKETGCQKGVWTSPNRTSQLTSPITSILY